MLLFHCYNYCNQYIPKIRTLNVLNTLRKVFKLSKTRVAVTEKMGYLTCPMQVSVDGCKVDV